MAAALSPPPPLRLVLSGAAPLLDADARQVPLAALDAVLLAWLAIEGPTPRERLASLLWPASDTEAARNALRQRLFRLRRHASRDLAVGTLQLALAEDVVHDLHACSGVLGTLALPECSELDAWLARQRALRQAQARRSTESRIEALEAAGDAAAALPLALALLDEEPLSEDAHRRVMRLHYLRGDHAAALLAFDRCEQLLKHEVGATPAAATLALLRTIESGTPAADRQASVGVPVSLLRPPRLIGRLAELQALRQGWRTGAVVIVMGEAGMGKSRLLQVLAQEAPALILACGRPGDSLVPYASFARLLKELAQRVPQALDEAMRRRLAPLLPALAPADAATASRRMAMLGPVTELLQASRGHFDGLVLDDVHFADSASLDLLQALLAAPRADDPIRWCLGLRPPEPGSRQQGLLEALAEAAPFTQVNVQPLDVSQTAELVDSLLLSEVRGAEIAPALRQRSGGNPLFALETLKLAWSEGTLPGQRGTSQAELPHPSSLAQLMTQQLARLSPTALMLARLAAIAGVDFSLPLAEAVLGQSALQLTDPWHELERQQVMVGTAFAHDLICDAVVSGVPLVIARHLHARVAEHLETGGGEPARLAAHWEAAGQRRRALPGLRAAAERAHAALREPERIDFLMRAADIAEAEGDLDLAFDCVTGAVDSHMNTIRQASGYPLLDRLDRLARSPTQRAMALGRRAWYCIQLADEAGALRHGKQALALAEPLGDGALLTLIRQRLATALAMAGRFDEALQHLQSAQSAADTTLPADQQAEFLGNFAVVLDNLGRPDEAAAHRQRAIDAARAAGDHAQQVSQLANHAVSRLNAGDVRQARDVVTQAQRLIASYDMRGSTVGFAAVLQVQCARALGHYAEALAAADQAQALLAQSNPARLPMVEMHRAHCWLDLGQHARARQALLASGEGAALPPHFEARRAVLMARLERLLRGDATPWLRHAAEMSPRHGWPEIGMIIDVESMHSLPPDDAIRLLEQTASKAGALRLAGSRLAACVRLAQCHAERGNALGAAPARQALELARSVEPTLMYRAELWLHCARALAAAGAHEEAARVAATGRHWVLERAEHDVPPPFRDSFLQRNPVNRELLAMA